MSVSPTNGIRPIRGRRITLTRVGIKPTTFLVLIQRDILNSHDLLPSDPESQSGVQRSSNPKVVGSIPTLARVFLFPCVGPVRLTELTLTWFEWIDAGICNDSSSLKVTPKMSNSRGEYCSCAIVKCAALRMYLNVLYRENYYRKWYKL